MDKLIRGIPAGSIAAMACKAEKAGLSTSAYIRGLIQKDARIRDIVIKDVPAATARGLALNAAKAGLTLGQYLLKMGAEECL